MPLENASKNEKRPLLWLQVFIVAITLTVVAVAILLGRQTYRETKKITTEQFNRQQLILARSAAIGIEVCLEEIGEELPVLAKMPAVQAMTPECLTQMRLVYGEESRKTSIRRLDEDGILRLIYPNEGWRGELIGRDYGEETFFIEARETGELTISGLIINEIGKMCVRAAYPVFIEDGKGAREFTGVIIASFDIEELVRLYVSPIVSGETGYAWLLNQNGVFVAHHEEEFIGRNAFEVLAESNSDISYEAIEQIQQQMMAGEEEVGRYVSGWHQGQKGEVEKLVAYTPVHIDDIIWSVAVCAPVSEVEGVIHETYQSELYTLGFVILALMACGLCLLIVSYRWSYSLEREVARRTKELRETIIERKRAEETLRESEERLRLVVQNMPVMLDAFDVDRNIIAWNRECERVTGYSAEEIIGNPKAMELLYDTDYLQRVLAEWTERGDDFRDWEIELTSKDGSVKTVLWTSMAERFSIPGWASWSIGVDITERKRAEEERARLMAQIQEQAQQMQQIMDTVPEGVLLLDAGGQVILANPVAEKDLSVLAGAHAGDTLTHLGDRPLAELLAHPPMGLWHEARVDGPPPQEFEIVARPIETGPMPGGWVLVIRDVTQEREIQQRAQQQERLAAVGQLAAGIAHDFNNIMATIVLYAQMVSRIDGLSARDQERLATIKQQAKQATDLIRQILDFGRRAVLERQPLDLATLLKEHVKLLERTLPENIQINLTYGWDAYTVNADPTRMQQVMMNLALNARDAMPEGGTLCFGLERIQVQPGESPPLPEMQAGEWVQVTVSDTGMGIPPDVLPRIFNPFFTTKAPGKGSGLGLAQVHGIVKQHGGEIDVKSPSTEFIPSEAEGLRTGQVGRGTTFIIYLPALLAHPPEPLTLELSALDKGQGETVLVVEDNRATREAVVDSLELLNYRVLTAANGQEALAVLEQHGDEIALLLSDVVMPGMGGVSLLHALRHRDLAVKVVLMTGHPLEKEMESLRAQGMSDWLSKPPSLEQLAQVLARVLNL